MTVNFWVVPCSVAVSVTDFPLPLSRERVKDAVDVEVPAVIVNALGPVGLTEPFPLVARSTVCVVPALTRLPPTSTSETLAVRSWPPLPSPVDGRSGCRLFRSG